MRERPILFNGAMVRAILAGTKTQTRRPVKACKDINFGCELSPGEIAGEVNLGGDYQNCPFEQPGDRLWVRESFMPIPPHNVGSEMWEIIYGVDAAMVERKAPETYRPMLYNYERWSPSIHMPRWACRLVLKIVSVRVERVQQISEADARAEGVYWSDGNPGTMGPTQLVVEARDEFHYTWDSIYAARGQGWAANPWVWVVEFKRAEVGHGAE